VPSGTSSVSHAFQGTFNTWFVDGTGFLTGLGNAVWTYSSAAIQENLTQVTGIGLLGGHGNWFWNTVGGLNIYQVGGGASPVFTTSTAEYVIPSGTTIGLFSISTDQLTVVDLSGATPVSASYTLPIDDLSAYAATSASAWLAGNEHGVILDGASLANPRYLTLGTASSIAAGTGYFSVATASGEILYFDASTDAVLGTINFASSQLSMSSDGTVLAAAPMVFDIQNPPATSVNVYSLPSATLINSFGTGGAPVDVSLSGSGTVLAVTGGTSGCEAEAVAVTGGAQILCVTTGTPNTAQLSPNGTLAAVSAGPLRVGTSTNIYTNGALTTAVNGWAVGWLDNTRLVANQFGQQNMNPVPVYLGADIFSSSGSNLGAAPIPQLQTLQVVSSDTIYSAQTNTILSLTTGAPTWASANAICPSVDSECLTPAAGAVSGSQVIFASGALVLAQPY